MTNLQQAVDDAARDIREWVQLATRLREWFTENHPDGSDAGPCPTDTGIRASKAIHDRLLVAMKELAERLALWKWAAESGCYTQKNSMLGLPPWDCRDIDGELLATGDTPENAIRRARQVVERMREGQE